LEVVRNLFSRNIVFNVVHEHCKVAVLKFLGLYEPKNFQSGCVVRKLVLVFSSFVEVMEFDFSDSSVSSSFGKDVLRVFQAILGIPILDSRFQKASHLGYLAHAQMVIRGAVRSSELVGCTTGDSVPVDVSGWNTGGENPPRPGGGWTLSIPDEDSTFYGTASDWLLLMLAFLSGCGDSGADWTEDLVVDYVRYVDCDETKAVECRYLTSVFLRRLEDSDIMELLSLFAHKDPVIDVAHAIVILVSIGISGDVALVRTVQLAEDEPTCLTPVRSVLASAARRGLPVESINAAPMCRSCPPADPATEEGWVERQAARCDYRLWDTKTLQDWISRRVHPSQVGVLKHTVLSQISTWLAGMTVDGRRRLSPSEPEFPFPPVECHGTRQFSDDVCSRVFSLSTLAKLSLYVLQAEMAVLCPSFRCLATDKAFYVRALLDAFPIRASGEAKRNSWLFLQRSKVPVYIRCIWPPEVTQNVLVALPFLDFANEGAEPVIAYYSLTQQYHDDDVVLLRVVEALPIVPSTIFMSKGEIVAILYAVPALGGSGIDHGSNPQALPLTSVFPASSVWSQSEPGGYHPVVEGLSGRTPTSRDYSGSPPGTLSVFPTGGFGAQALGTATGMVSSTGSVGDLIGPRPSASVDASGIPGLTLVAREQPSRAKGDRTLKALMIADAFVRMVSVDPVRVLGTVMAEVFLSLVTHTGILTQLALVEVTQILQSVNFPSYALAIPLTMSSRHDIAQALTTAKLFVGWRSEEAFPESRAVRYDYRSNDPLLVYRVLWTIFRVRYGFFEFHPEIWEALVRYSSRCEKIVRDLFHWTQEAVDFMITKALRDLEMLDDRVGLTVPSALVAPSPDAVQACPILDRFAYRDAIDLLPDMRDPIAYYTHHQLVMRAQQLHAEGTAVRYVIPLSSVPPFKTGGGGGKHALRGIPVVGQQPSSTTPSVTKKDRSATFLKKRRIDGLVVSAGGPATPPVPLLAPTPLRLAAQKNRPCHQWLSTTGCSRGSCRFDHAAPTTKGIWNSCRDELARLALTAGVQMGVCPVL